MRFFGYAGRVVVFCAVVTWFFGIVYPLGRLRVAFRRGRDARRRALGALRGRVIRRAFTALGATFVKLGQVLSTRPDLLGPEVIGELRLLQDRLPPFPFARARRLVEGDLGAPLEERFASFEPAPVAAASVAQVHRARLRDGTEVAVKVLRPDVRRKVQRDAAILTAGARLIELIPRFRLSQPVEHLRHFVAGILEQTDLRLELANYRRFAANFADMPGVRFPRVHPELSGEHVMTMEFVRGTKLDALPSGRDEALAARLLNVILKMCFEDAFVHADLHPGNLLLAESGDLIIFDVGLVQDIPDGVLVQFMDFTKCMVMGGPKDFLNHMRTFHTYAKDVDWPALEADLTGLFTRFRALTSGQMELGGLTNDLFTIARRHRVRPVPEMILVIVAIVTAEGIGKQLHPENNLFASCAAFLTPLLDKRGLSVMGTRS